MKPVRHTPDVMQIVDFGNMNIHLVLYRADLHRIHILTQHNQVITIAHLTLNGGLEIANVTSLYGSVIVKISTISYARSDIMGLLLGAVKFSIGAIEREDSSLETVFDYDNTQDENGETRISTWYDEASWITKMQHQNHSWWGSGTTPHASVESAVFEYTKYQSNYKGA